jgi:hypothetical protein
LRTGATVKCRMWRDDDARYLFDMKLDSNHPSLPGLRFFHTTAMERVQGRQHFRVRHDQTADLGVINKPVDSVDEADVADLYVRPIVTSVRGRITNLSAGGFATVVHQPVSKSVFLRAVLDLEESEPLTTISRIVSVNDMAAGRLLLRTQFVGLSQDDRERIAKHVTVKQQHFEDAHAG